MEGRTLFLVPKSRGARVEEGSFPGVEIGENRGRRWVVPPPDVETEANRSR